MYKKIFLAFIALFIAGSMAFSQQKFAIQNTVDSNSYAIGVSYGINLVKNLSDNDIKFNIDAIFAGIKDVVDKQTPQLTDQQVQSLLMALQQDLMAKNEKKQKEIGEANKTKGDAFLAENKTKPGVMTTASGLQYKVVTEGKGKKPDASSKVKVHYKGTLIDGKVFDSSIDRGQPAQFPVNGVIKGWTEALQLMPVGSKWMLYIPSDLAYGDRGAGGAIGPNETLIFEVDLLEIIDESAAPQEAKPVPVEKQVEKKGKDSKKK